MSGLRRALRGAAGGVGRVRFTTRLIVFGYPLIEFLLLWLLASVIGWGWAPHRDRPRCSRRNRDHGAMQAQARRFGAGRDRTRARAGTRRVHRRAVPRGALFPGPRVWIRSRGACPFTPAHPSVGDPPDDPRASTRSRGLIECPGSPPPAPSFRGLSLAPKIQMFRIFRAFPIFRTAPATQMTLRTNPNHRGELFLREPREP